MLLRADLLELWSAFLLMRRGWYAAMNPSTFRIVIVGGVVLISALGVAAFAVVLAGELTDRSIVVLTAILGFLGPTIASLLVLLRVDANGAQTERVQQKVEAVHHDLLNGGLRDNVKRAISESEQDPATRERRIDNVAKGVQRDRHDKASRDTIELNAVRLAELRRKRDQEGLS